MLEESLHLSSKYLAQEAKVKSTVSRVVTLEVENSKLKKDLITTMDETNLSKEKAKTLSDDLKAKRQLTMEKDKQLLAAKEKIKTIAVEAVKGFQQTKEYNTVLFSWYFNRFEHPSRVDLENLGLKEVNKEMATVEASNSTTPNGDAPKSALPPSTGDDAIANA